MHSNALVTNMRKRNTCKKSQRITEQCSGASICKNLVCRAMISGPNKFCTRCSCCICKNFDGDGKKDPSLWLECAPDSPVRSCGLSCHIRCALEDGRVGVVNICQRVRLDGGYWCFHCVNISGILGCLKKQLTLAKDTSRVALLFDRIDLCVKLLDGTRRFQDLLEIVKEVKRLLDGEVISLDGSSSDMAPNLVGRLLAAAEVRKLCAAALRRVDELSATPSLQGPNLWMPDQMVFPGTSGAQSMPLQLDLNVAAEPESDADVALAMDDADPVWVPAVIFQAEVASTEAHEEVPDLNEDVAPFHDSSMGNTDPGCDVSENRALHEEVPAVNVQAEVERERPVSRDDLNVVAAPVKDSSMENTDLGCDVSVTLPAVNVQAEVESVRPARPEVPGNLDGNYEYCMGVIRGLEVGGYITSEDRQKLFTWFSLGSDERQRKVVYTYMISFGSDLSALAEQLFDSYGVAIRNS